MQVLSHKLLRILGAATTPAFLFGADAVLLVVLISNNWPIAKNFARLDAEYPGLYIEEFAIVLLVAGFACLILAIRRSYELRHEIAARRRAEDVADRLARHDPLTGLPNRRVFHETVARMISELRQGDSVATMLLDLENFKLVNDSYGHAIGDELLCAVAQRICTVAANKGLVARLGGDEFVIATTVRIDKIGLAALADNIVSDLAVPFFLQDRRICIGASVGISICPHDADTVSTLLHAADVAMYRAKQGGRSTFRFFEPDMDLALREQAELRADLQQAIITGEIVPFYQPLIHLVTRNIDGFEVLARWQHPTRGLLAPEKFIALAEGMKLITPLTLALFRQVCADARDWPEHYRLTLNISPVQLPDAHLFIAIAAMMAEAGIAMSRLEVELTESSLIKDIQQASRIIDQLRATGITVALDDFGTGYSSLYHLREINFDKVKIDRSFVQSIGRDPRAASYVEAMIGLGHSLHLQTTAEGIEDADVLAKLEQLGCTFGQGYLFAKPLSGQEVRHSMRQIISQGPEMHWQASPALPSAA